MYEYTDKSLLKSDADFIFVPITTEPLLNCGYALEAKILYPEIEKFIKEEYFKGKIKLGSISIFKNNDQQKLICIPDRRDNRTIPTLQYISEAIRSLRRFILDHNVKSISIPVFGVDDGGLTWAHVKLVLKQEFKDVEDIKIYIHQDT